MTRCYPKTDKSWTDYRALTKKGFSASIDGPCNHFFRLFKMDGNDLKTYFCINKKFCIYNNRAEGKNLLTTVCYLRRIWKQICTIFLFNINRYFIKIYLCLTE